MKGGGGLRRGDGGRDGQPSPLPLGIWIPNPTWEGAGVLGKDKEGAGSPARCEPGPLMCRPQ